MRETGDGFVTSSILQPALRETRLHLAQPQALAALAGVALVLGLSGPFHTLTSLPMMPRLAYWTAVVFATYATGTLVTILLRAPFAGQSGPVRVVLTGAINGLAVTLVLLVINAALLREMPGNRIEWLLGIGSVLVITTVIEAVAEIARHSRANAASGPPDRTLADPSTSESGANAVPATAAPALILRLALHKRGDLLCVSVQDHYVEVTTSNGRDMVLMRLGDAIKETAGVAGLQVHRSHWVALRAVAAARRAGDGAVLTLQSGAEIPVSRSYLAAVQTAGLLPRRGGP